jgi:hypothetical protein
MLETKIQRILKKGQGSRPLEVRLAISARIMRFSYINSDKTFKQSENEEVVVLCS